MIVNPAKFNYYNSLLPYGNICALKNRFNASEYLDWTLDNFDYVRYNPEKDISRYGLSITSLDGDVNGIPDLDTLRNWPQYKEEDFHVTTAAYEHPEIKKLLKPFDGYYVRTHILKIDSGGFFPPHRDAQNICIKRFRIIVPLRNVLPPSVNFVIDGVVTPHWEIGRMYYINTALLHYLFNASMDPSYWLVINVKANEYTTDYVVNNLKN